MQGAWKRFRYRLEWLAVLTIFKLVPLFSRRACYQLGGLAGTLAARFDRRGHGVAMVNLEAAFGDEYSETRRAEIVRESYQHFARTMLDLFWSPRLNADNFRQYVEFEGTDQTKMDIEPSNSCIVASFHYGNFEWLSLAFGWVGYPGAIITQEFKNPLLDGIFQKLRERSGHTTVPRGENAIIRLYNILRRKGRVALLGDTTLPPHHPTVVIDCFGLKTIVTVAHAFLQRRTGVPIIPLYCKPLRDGRYRVVTHPKVQPPEGATHQEIAQACWDSFEPVVRKDPAPWLWMYKHWRYRPRATERKYPFYAQESAAFEQIASRPNYAPLERASLSIPASGSEAPL